MAPGHFTSMPKRVPPGGLERGSRLLNSPPPKLLTQHTVLAEARRDALHVATRRIGGHDSLETLDHLGRRGRPGMPLASGLDEVPILRIRLELVPHRAIHAVRLLHDELDGPGLDLGLELLIRQDRLDLIG